MYIRVDAYKHTTNIYIYIYIYINVCIFIYKHTNINITVSPLKTHHEESHRIY
jgi:hypothetical protein